MKKYLAFYLPYFLFVICLLVLILTNEKASLHLMLTSFYTNIGDVFFKYYTEVGGNIPFVVIAGLLFYKYRIALILLITQLITGLLVYFIKSIWNQPRPVKYFAEHYPDIQLHKIEGVQLHGHYSFPSGHTASAFAFFLVLAYFTKKPAMHFLYFFMAVMVGFSRVYLSQHFVFDLMVGSLVGVVVATLCQIYLVNKPMRWADGSLRDVFSRK